MTHTRATQLLRGASAICIAFGVLMFLSLPFQLGSLFGLFLDLAHLPIDGRQTFTSDSELLLGAISGGLLTGLGVITWQVTNHVYATNPEIGGRIMMYGLISWFVIDSTGSIFAGAWFNVVLNSGFLALFVVPIQMAHNAKPMLSA
ncbi:excinuclease ABC subunit A [uncultured Ruegeria sp.]|uniref:excinuclease ABC subunit A n=1 Tax=uncultured Ruegeria sp. TaxID=259304 RepID=UPI002632A083|nr:excinuclease ABC subunit A [uncultured Ruegeria sp.]